VLVIKIFNLLSGIFFSEKTHRVSEHITRDVSPPFHNIGPQKIFMKLDVPWKLITTLIAEVKLAKPGGNEAPSRRGPRHNLFEPFKPTYSQFKVNWQDRSFLKYSAITE